MGFLHVGLRPRAQDGKLSSYIANNMSEKVEGYKCEKCKDDGIYLLVQFFAVTNSPMQGINDAVIRSHIRQMCSLSNWCYLTPSMVKRIAFKSIAKTHWISTGIDHHLINITPHIS